MAAKKPINPFEDMDALMASSRDAKLTSNKPAASKPVAAPTAEKKKVDLDFNVFDAPKPKATSSTAKSNVDFNIFDAPKPKASTAGATVKSTSTTSTFSPSKHDSTPLDIFSIPTISSHTSPSKNSIAKDPSTSLAPASVPIDNASLDFLLGIGTANKPSAASATSKQPAKGTTATAVKYAVPVVPNFDDIIQVAAVPFSNGQSARNIVEISPDMIQTIPQKKPAVTAAIVSVDLLGNDEADDFDLLGSTVPPPRPQSNFDLDLDFLQNNSTAVKPVNNVAVKSGGSNNSATSFDMFDVDDDIVGNSSYSTQQKSKPKNKHAKASSSFDMFGDDDENDDENNDNDDITDDNFIVEAPPPARKSVGNKKPQVSSFDMFGDDDDLDYQVKGNANNNSHASAAYETDDFDATMQTGKAVMQFGEDDDVEEVKPKVAAKGGDRKKGGEKASIDNYREEYGITQSDVNDEFDQTFDNRTSESSGRQSADPKRANEKDTRAAADTGKASGGFGKSKTGTGGGSASQQQSSGNNNNGISSQPAKKSFAKPADDNEDAEEVSDIPPMLSPKYSLSGDILYRETTASLFLSKEWTAYYYVFQESNLMLFDSKADYDSTRGRGYRKIYNIVYNFKVNKPRPKDYKRELLYNFLLEEIRDYGPVNICKFANPDKSEAEDFYNQLVHVINYARSEYKSRQVIKR